MPRLGGGLVDRLRRLSLSLRFHFCLFLNVGRKLLGVLDGLRRQLVEGGDVVELLQTVAVLTHHLLYEDDHVRLRKAFRDYTKVLSPQALDFLIAHREAPSQRRSKASKERDETGYAGLLGVQQRITVEKSQVDPIIRTAVSLK